MKKLFTILFIAAFVSVPPAFADGKQDAVNFFNNYVRLANDYSTEITKMYTPNAKIIRQVVKPDGTTQDVYTNTDTYIKQMKIGQAGAKVRGYKNYYTNVTVTQVGNDMYKISSLRQPSGETYKLKTYQVIKKQPNGKWLIIEELMQTKQQIFLKYAQ